ncbi:MAG TPA: hypothetical protein VNP72_09625 [Longimicrobium sp.]|nr:hypothetical protein [Longimicrobium sp.]
MPNDVNYHQVTAHNMLARFSTATTGLTPDLAASVAIAHAVLALVEEIQKLRADLARPG